MHATSTPSPLPQRGLPPVLGTRLRVLVLGTFPGERSLEEGQYYAHPRNRMWPALAPVIGVPAGAPYRTRLLRLRQAGLGLWDVLAACERRGSLDQNIRAVTAVPNDLRSVVAAHPGLRAVCLNGGSAARLFDRFQLPRALWTATGLRIVTLPSTSPAHARMSDAAVHDAWRTALTSLLARVDDSA